jgi:hypothetical protein
VLFGGGIPSTSVVALLVDGLAERSLDELVDGSKRLSVVDAANYAVQLLTQLADLHARGSPSFLPSDCSSSSSSFFFPYTHTSSFTVSLSLSLWFVNCAAYGVALQRVECERVTTAELVLSGRAVSSRRETEQHRRVCGRARSTD